MITGEQTPDPGTLRVGDPVQLAYADQSRTPDPEKAVAEANASFKETVESVELVKSRVGP